MPTYDYKCDKCGHSMETFHSITAKPLKKCPKCGKNGLKRLVGAGAALIFKGSGFYCTDYRKSGSTPPSSSASSEGSTPAKSETPSKDSGKSAKPDSNAKKTD